MDMKGDIEPNMVGISPRNLQAFASSSSLHGINHIFVYGCFSLRRALWLLAFLISLALLLFISTDRVQHYFDFPHITALEEVYVPFITFPVVTICNLNAFRLSHITRNDLFHAGEFLNFLDDQLKIVEPNKTEPHVLTTLLELSDFRKFKPEPFNMREFSQRTGHNLQEMLLHCRFRGKTCSADDFDIVYTRYGKCHSFNLGKSDKPLQMTIKGGTGNGLKLMLDAQQDDYLPVWAETEESTLEAGFKVQIHNQDEPPFMHQLGFGISPGFQTFVSCQKQQLIYLPPPWGVCIDQPKNLDYFDTYSITACRIECETRYVFENCNCRMMHMPGDAPMCTPSQYRNCADPALNFLTEKDSEYCLCKTPCNMTRFAKEFSMVKIPSKASAKYLASKYNKTEEYIRENILLMDIFFEALNFEKIEQKKAYLVASLLGDIGGQMGLFIGASILTIFEIIDYLYEGRSTSVGSLTSCASDTTP
uniref:Acid sensing ion channel subunit 1 n=1 Tax=Eptatretus burgeri TaxID=7764 RepID=A0A8C4NJT9_EPTBU